MRRLNAAMNGEGWLVDSIWPPMLALAFGMLVIALPQSDFFRAIPGDMGDPRFNLLTLEHVLRWLRGIDASLFSPGFFFPFPGALTFSDNHFGTVGLYALLRLVGLSPEGSYIGWFTFAYVVNFLCAHVAFRRFGLSASGSALGALLFAFAMPVLAQASHGQLGYRFAVPLAVLSLHRLLREGHPAQLGWLGIWVTLQFYCSIYIGYFLLLLLGGYLLAASIVPAKARPFLMRPHRLVVGLVRWPDRAEWWRCIGVLVVCAVALIVLFVPYVYYADLYGFVRNPADIATMLPRVGSYLLADGSSVWGGPSQHLTGIPVRHEHQMFVGAAACVLAGIGVTRGRSHWIKVSALALALLVILTLNIGGFSLYALLEHLPLANAIRAVSRIGLVLLFPMGLLVGAGFDQLMVGARTRVGTVLAGALTLVLLVECAAFQTERLPLKAWADRIALRIAETPTPLALDAILYVPHQPNESLFMHELDGMSLAQRLGSNTINGYSGNSPPRFSKATDPCDDLIDRLTGYARFMKVDVTQVDGLMRRVVPIGTTLDCERPSSRPQRTHFNGPLAAATFANIRVDIASLAIANAQQLGVDLIVSNRLDRPLASVSDSNEPIRFSWRFVSTDAGAPLSGDWAPRSDLTKDVPSHASTPIRLRIDTPTTAGRYRLEVTMVQEGVAWFHELGMPIARNVQVFEVGTDGRIRGDIDH